MAKIAENNDHSIDPLAFCSFQIHTYAGPTIIAVNPMAPLSIYSDKVYNFSSVFNEITEVGAKHGYEVFI
jgi:hypothetical protein